MIAHGENINGKDVVIVQTMSSIVYNIDCMEGMKQYPDKFFDLAVVDPPYGINVAKMAYTQEDNRPCKQSNGATLTVKKNLIDALTMTIVEAHRCLETL